MSSPLDVSTDPALASLLSDAGTLSEGPWKLADAFVPAHLELDRGWLLWWWHKPGDVRTGAKEVDPRGMLQAFVRLRDKEGVLRFAQRYGVLSICEDHRLPSSHNRGIAYAGRDTSCKPAGFSKGLCEEPVSVWLSYARQARAILKIAAAVHKGEPATLEQWAVAYERLHEANVSEMVGPRTDAALDAVRLAMFVNNWLITGSPSFRLQWLYSRPKPEILVTGGTFGVLALQLAAAVGAVHGVAICDGCSQAYTPIRKPQIGRRHYCRDCGEPVASRLRQRDHSERRRRKRNEQERE